MENKKQGFLGAYKCLVLFAVMMVVAFVVTMFKPKAETYVAQADGFVGYVKVQVSIVNGEITAVQILESTESAGIADPALEQIPAAIVAAQSTDVDVVAGCSFASRAIMAAVDDCLVQAGLKEAPEETEAPTVAEGAWQAGTYTATAQGMGKVTVTVTIDENGVITEILLDTPGETPGLGDKGAQKVADSILTAQSTDVDVASGATMSSKAVINAVNDCLTQAASGSGSGAASGGNYKAGTYTATAQGMGKVTVTVTIDENGVITEILLDTPGETPGLGDKGAQKVADSIMTAQSTDVDVASGATMSSKAVINAVADCLAQAQ
ncbi:MAG: FMN-binding protein [Lachnospiraceae bacterium]|nr:FMN-binding protein [Lachnospiraceae bacterium]